MEELQQSPSSGSSPAPSSVRHDPADSPAQAHPSPASRSSPVQSAARQGSADSHGQACQPPKSDASPVQGGARQGLAASLAEVRFSLPPEPGSARGPREGPKLSQPSAPLAQVAQPKQPAHPQLPPRSETLLDVAKPPQSTQPLQPPRVGTQVQEDTPPEPPVKAAHINGLPGVLRSEELQAARLFLKHLYTAAAARTAGGTQDTLLPVLVRQIVSSLYRSIAMRGEGKQHQLQGGVKEVSWLSAGLEEAPRGILESATSPGSGKGCIGFQLPENDEVVRLVLRRCYAAACH